MKTSKLDMMKLADSYDGEFDPADFTAEELEELLGLHDENLTIEELRARYFEFYDDIKDRTLAKHKWSD